MEHVRGESLKQRIMDGGNLDESEVIVLLQQMADALDYAHTSIGVLHRDVKPANIILGQADPVRMRHLPRNYVILAWRKPVWHRVLMKRPR